MTDLAAMSPPQVADATAPPARLCADCGYDLRGLQHNRCPECGLEFDPTYLPPADIPWLRRENLLTGANPGGDGIIAAYCKTVWLVLARPKKFGQTVWQEVEVDAFATAWFRWITIGIACGSLLASMLPVFLPLSSRSLLFLIVLIAPMIMFFWLATERFGIGEFRAARYDQEQRFRRLHDLSCAGLALMILVPLFLLLGVFMGWRGSYVGPRAFALLWLVMLAWWYGTVRYQIHGGRCRTGDVVLHALLLPFVWFMIAAVIFIFTVGVTGLLAPLVGP